MIAFETLQYKKSTAPDCSKYNDPVANAKAIKSLSYFLGPELTGICEIPDYAWYSHRADGSPIEPYHKHAICMLVDQGFETMEVPVVMTGYLDPSQCAVTCGTLRLAG